MALVNIKKAEQMDALQKQRIANEVSAQFGSLAFMYAKHVYKEYRALDTLSEPYLSQVPLIFAYLESQNYEQVLS